MENFTPVTALLGGFMIGGAALMLLYTLGRTAGISGILAGILKPEQGETGWRMSFVLGLLAAPVLLGLVNFEMATLPEYPVWLLVIGGLLVGVGVRISNGCTSGHGICGMGRLSVRSFIATGIFMLIAMFSVGLIRPELMS